MPFLIDEGGDSFVSGDEPHGVCVAFQDDTLEEQPVWERLDDPAGFRLASAWTISRGRQSELDKTGTGTASVTFVDTDGVLDPTNNSGPFYTGGETHVDPMRQAAIALMNPVTGEWGTLFRGYISDMTHSVDMWTDERGLDTVSMELVDAFDLFNAVELTPGDHGDSTPFSDFADVFYGGHPSNFTGYPASFVHVDDRIAQILDDIGWPNSGKRAGLRNIFSGNVSMQGNVYSRRDSALQALFDAADAEFPGVANIYMSKNGVVTFHGRFARFFPERAGYGIGSWTVGSLAQAELDSDCAPIAGLEFRRSKADIINAALISPRNSTEAQIQNLLVKDTASIAKYGWRSISFEELLIWKGHDEVGDDTTAQEECFKFGNYYVDNYAVPKTRVSSITFRPRGIEQTGAEPLWDLMVNVEIGDVVTLKTEHPSDGGFDEDFFVEGIRYDSKPAREDMLDVTMTLDVSPRSFYDSNPFGDWDDT